MPWDQVMHKWKAGALKSGGSGRPVTSQKQAIAIMLSEKRAAGEGKTEYKSRQSHYRSAYLIRKREKAENAQHHFKKQS